ncbi:hypothetical protein [Serratia rubidaea]|uniref:hypothetical protein n=1 Tax=Serratia rubidaea TaxID=61652 RepID=UPI001BB0461B|nr:hypothetical protein [Serratia rubidaea]MBS0972543.1 hypothetical protein [Serratia rubidaea]
MKNVFILSALGLSLLASANVMAAEGLMPDRERSSATYGDRILFQGNYNTYRTSNYALSDLEKFESKLQDHENELKQLRDENRNKDRQIDELKRSLQEQSNKVKG